MDNLAKLCLKYRHFLNILVIGGSAFLCLLLSLSRLPSTELLEIAPNWVLMWVVCWSLKRTVFQGFSAGLSLGLIEDGLTGVYPSHVISLVIVGVFIATLSQRRYIQEAMISVVLIVFVMVMMAETFTALQFTLSNARPIAEVWQNYQQISLVSAILSSLWTPVLYYPLDCWWTYLRRDVSGKRFQLSPFRFERKK